MSREWKHIETPFTEGLVSGLRSGDLVLITGRIYTARDKAHERLCAMIDRKEPLPFDAEGQVLYYVGPTPAPKGRVIGSAGPTTSYRMDAFTGKILGAGIRGMIGKGRRDAETKRHSPELWAITSAASAAPSLSFEKNRLLQDYRLRGSGARGRIRAGSGRFSRCRGERQVRR